MWLKYHTETCLVFEILITQALFKGGIKSLDHIDAPVVDEGRP